MNGNIFGIGLLLATLATTAGAAPALEGAQPGEWTMDFDAAKALAAETGRPLLLHFAGSDWCGWCRAMDQQVFSQEAWQTYARDRWILVQIDFPQDKSRVPEAFARRNEELMRTFAVEGIPTYLLLAADGQTPLGRLGIVRDPAPARFIAALEDVWLASAPAVAALKETLSAEQVAALDEARSAVDLARQKLQEALAAESEPSDETNALADNLRDEIERAEATYSQLLKEARQPPAPARPDPPAAE